MHIIRLRGPWQLEPVKRFVRQIGGTYHSVEEGLPPAVKMDMPADWSAAFGADFLGRVRYRRVFHWTTPLYETERVYLVVEPPRSEACITLEKKLVGHVYAGEPAGRFEITDRLERDNVLEIFVDHPDVELVGDNPDKDALQFTIDDAVLSLPGGLIGEVRLEVEE